MISYRATFAAGHLVALGTPALRSVVEPEHLSAQDAVCLAVAETGLAEAFQAVNQSAEKIVKNKHACVGLVIMRGDLHSRGLGLESQYRILDGHFFTLYYCKNFVWKRPKINQKEPGDSPFKKTMLKSTRGVVVLAWVTMQKLFRIPVPDTGRTFSNILLIKLFLVWNKRFSRMNLCPVYTQGVVT